MGAKDEHGEQVQNGINHQAVQTTIDDTSLSIKNKF